ncbi:hypothetical protein KIPB_000044 [Kipferlia bialata]|uniref:Uncharacterized protein n=1 Tax=Kipferlia bialata TaxID=797122 RepID=A0A9K3CMZ7_9EUKA|nr:hypothetical protein KIPB_000044 [Kipferlia bialata]|eukprot:g44.t1
MGALEARHRRGRVSIRSSCVKGYLPRLEVIMTRWVNSLLPKTYLVQDVCAAMGDCITLPALFVTLSSGSKGSPTFPSRPSVSALESVLSSIRENSAIRLALIPSVSELMTGEPRVIVPFLLELFSCYVYRYVKARRRSVIRQLQTIVSATYSGFSTEQYPLGLASGLPLLHLVYNNAPDAVSISDACPVPPTPSTQTAPKSPWQKRGHRASLGLSITPTSPGVGPDSHRLCNFRLALEGLHVLGVPHFLDADDWVELTRPWEEVHQRVSPEAYEWGMWLCTAQVDSILTWFTSVDAAVPTYSRSGKYHPLPVNTVDGRRHQGVGVQLDSVLLRAYSRHMTGQGQSPLQTMARDGVAPTPPHPALYPPLSLMTSPLSRFETSPRRGMAETQPVSPLRRIPQPPSPSVDNDRGRERDRLSQTTLGDRERERQAVSRALAAPPSLSVFSGCVPVSDRVSRFLQTLRPDQVGSLCSPVVQPRVQSARERETESQWERDTYMDADRGDEVDTRLEASYLQAENEAVPLDGYPAPRGTPRSVSDAWDDSRDGSVSGRESEEGEDNPSAPSHAMVDPPDSPSGPPPSPRPPVSPIPSPQHSPLCLSVSDLAGNGDKAHSDRHYQCFQSTKQAPSTTGPDYYPGQTRRTLVMSPHATTAVTRRGVRRGSVGTGHVVDSVDGLMIELEGGGGIGDMVGIDDPGYGHQTSVRYPHLMTETVYISGRERERRKA